MRSDVRLKGIRGESSILRLGARQWPSGSKILTSYANGTYDCMMQGMVAVWANLGYRIQYWRPGVEMNLVGSPGFVGSSYSLQQMWIAAFRHIYTTMHAAAAAVRVKLFIVSRRQSA